MADFVLRLTVDLLTSLPQGEGRPTFQRSWTYQEAFVIFRVDRFRRWVYSTKVCDSQGGLAASGLMLLQDMPDGHVTKSKGLGDLELRHQ